MREMPLSVGWCGLLEGYFLWISKVLSEPSKMEDGGGFLTSVMGKRGGGGAPSCTYAIF